MFLSIEITEDHKQLLREQLCGIASDGTKILIDRIYTIYNKIYQVDQEAEGTHH